MVIHLMRLRRRYLSMALRRSVWLACRGGWRERWRYECGFGGDSGICRLEQIKSKEAICLTVLRYSQALANHLFTLQIYNLFLTYTNYFSRYSKIIFTNYITSLCSIKNFYSKLLN